jgi:Sec-independent protein translocase protein TatA
MPGFPAEVLFLCALGYVVLGPKRMQTLLQRIARVKAEFDKTRRQITSELTTEHKGGTEDSGI